MSNKNKKMKNGLPIKEEVVKSEEVEATVTNEQIEKEVVVEDNANDNKGNLKNENKEQQKIKSDVKKDKKNAKGKKKANANNPEKRTLAQKTKATVSELKKVTWPTFGQTVKQTGVVIGFVLIFIVILLGLNSLFGWLFNLIIDALA